MARQPWAPISDQQKKLLAALTRAVKREEDAKEDVRRILTDCAEAGIPIARLAEELKVQRKTIYRRIGLPMQ